MMKRRPGWIPPLSPIGIIQESLYPNEWYCLVVCIMLNCTSRKQVERIWSEFVVRFPTPQALLASSDDEVKAVISSLGFKDRRTKMLFAMTREYVKDEWTSVRELPGIGEYAVRMHEMLFCGHLGDVPPKDHALVRVWEWMKGRER